MCEETIKMNQRDHVKGYCSQGDDTGLKYGGVSSVKNWQSPVLIQHLTPAAMPPYLSARLACLCDTASDLYLLSTCPALNTSPV